jgi:putative transposase
LLRNYPITPIRAPVDIGGVSQPAPVRREYLNRVCFWYAVNLARKLAAFQDYYNGRRVHRAIAGLTPAQRAGALSPAPAEPDHYGWQRHCQGLFELPIAA